MAISGSNQPDGIQRKRRKLSPAFMIVGTTITWLTTIAPITVLLSWLFEQSTAVWLLTSMPLAPFATIGLWHAIQSRHLQLRWPVMQYFGWGAVLLPLTIVGAVLTIWLPQSFVGTVTLGAWLVLGTIGVLAASKISECYLAFNHHRLDRPYKLVQLSDLHVGSRSSAFLQQAVDQALRHQPDALLITGDLIDASAVQTKDLSALADLPCPVYLSLGNHERYLDLDAAIAMIEANGIIVLRSQSTTNGCLQIIGVDDADHPDQVQGELPAVVLSDDHYRILLYHRPDGWSAAREAGIDLMLAGHTHGGQIWPFNYLVQWRFEHLVGLFSESNQHLYVSPGTGCWGPIMRLGTRAELTVIDLLPAAVAEG